MSVTDGFPVKVKKAYPLTSTVEVPLKAEMLPILQVESRPEEDEFQLLVRALQSACCWLALKVVVEKPGIIKLKTSCRDK
jgi:hypothetical protein